MIKSGMGPDSKMLPARTATEGDEKPNDTQNPEGASLGVLWVTGG
jgi:hypothetical protein